MKTRSIAILLLLLLPLLLTSCLGQIEDTNGEDTALCTLTDEQILAEHPSISTVGSVASRVNDKQTLRVNKLSGVYVFDSFLLQNEDLSLTVSTTLHEGNLRIVLLCDGVYVQDVPIGEDQTVSIANANGRYQVRLAGESAKLDATVTLNAA